MSRATNVIRVWLPLAVMMTAFSALAYITVQQALRQEGNDPQIQMAEDAAAALDLGANIDAVVPKSQVEFSNSLAAFLLVYDGNGKLTASSGLLDGKMPDYPGGALAAARQSGENRVTWQPRADVRIASVAVPYKDGYVVAGRSLREVEKREEQTQTISVTAWILSLAVVLAVVVFGEFALNSR